MRMICMGTTALSFKTMVGPISSFTFSAVERASMHNLNEGQKLSFDVQADPRSGKSAAANLQAV